MTQSARASCWFGPLLALALLGTTPVGCSETQPDARRDPTSPAPTTANCGRKGLPDCPLQGWMKATVLAYVNAGDSQRLSASLVELASHAPSGYGGWAESANAGAEAARAGDIAGAKAQCKECHERNRARYRAEMRTTRLF